MSIHNLPNEVSEIILGCLSEEPDLFHVAQTSRLFYVIALPQLYRRNQENDKRGGGISFQAASQGRLDILNRAVMCGISMNDLQLALNAVQSRRFETFKFLVAHRTNEFSREDLFVLVEKACRSPNFDILNMLFDDLDATIDQQHPWRCLTEATWANSMSCVQFLLDRGADATVNSDDPRAKWPLEIAAVEDYSDVANCLLSHGATSRPTGDTPLHLAAMYGNVRVIQVLLNHNPDASLISASRDTPLRLAIRFGHAAAAIVILQESPTHAADERTLRAAVAQGYTEVVRLHLEAGVSALHLAEDVGLPLERPRSSLLYLAAETGSCPMIDLLLNAGVDPHVGNVYGESPLFVAVKADHLSAVDLLLSRGANPNTTGKTGLTPMHVAAQRGNTSIMTTLVRHGAGTATETRFDKVTPLHLACTSINGINTVKFLLQRGHRVEAQARGNGISCLHMATLFGQFDTVRWLLNDPAGAELLNSSDHVGRTALFIAAREGHLLIAKELIARKADLRKPDHFGSMPIFAAVRNKKVNITKELLDADPGLLGSKDQIYGGHTLFDWACMNEDTSHGSYLTRCAKDAGPDMLKNVPVYYARSSTNTPQRGGEPCDICARRFSFLVATQCTTCCGGEFYICYDCKHKAHCLDKSHSIASGDWLADPPEYVADHYKSRVS